MAVQDERDRDYASPGEAARELASMSAADLIRVQRFARIRAAGIKPWDWEDLLNEAVARVLAGTRRWPRHLPLVVFLRGTIRSLAEEERRRRAQDGYRSGTHDMDEATSVSDDSPGPDRDVVARDILRQLLARVEGDALVGQVIAGLERGETAAETCTRAGISAQTYDAARKRFRRSVGAWLEESETSDG